MGLLAQLQPSLACRGREAALARAGSIGAAMLHSLVEYPMRTAAILALCAL